MIIPQVKKLKLLNDSSDNKKTKIIHSVIIDNPYYAKLFSILNQYFDADIIINDSSNNYDTNNRSDSNNSKVFNESNYSADRNNTTLNSEIKLSVKINRNSKEDNNRESYSLKIRDNQVFITGDDSGVIYGIQTLFQLIVTNNVTDLDIEDAPRYSWRGFMLDESRHFFGKKTVMQLLVILSNLKINKFHWHLSDDQGWRIEIKQYPKLTEIGAYRKSTQIGGLLSYITKKQNNTPHSGYYTQDDIREIVEFAKILNIDIIPEIDIPGHTTALIASYNELSCDNTDNIEVATHFGIKKNILCVGNPNTYRILENIFDEIIDLFPSGYIHIGGDEVKFDNWKNCDKCQQLKKKLMFEDERELYSHFIGKMISYLQSKNVKVIGWNDIIPDHNIENFAKSGIMIQQWMGKKNKLKEFIRNNGKVIMSDFFHTYLDYNYYMTSLKKVYNYNPNGNIMGIEAPLWTEWVHDTKRLYWQIFPRLIAIAEITWYGNDKYKDFKNRLNNYEHILDKINVNYCKIPDPPLLLRFLKPLLVFKEPKL